MSLIPILLLIGSTVVHGFRVENRLDTLLITVLGLVTLLPIYFGDELGSYTGFWMKGACVDEPTPGIFIRVVGWVALLIVCAALIAGAHLGRAS